MMVSASKHPGDDSPPGPTDTLRSGGIEPQSGQRVRRSTNGDILPARLLIVDDEDENRMVLQKYFTQRGLDVEAVGNGRDALARIDTFHPDVVLLDRLMPDLGGDQVLAELRRKHDVDDVRVIMTTAIADSAEVAATLDRGANDYVSKPYDLAVVGARVSSQLRAKQTRERFRTFFERLSSAQTRITWELSRRSVDDWAPLVAAEIARVLESDSPISVWLSGNAGADGSAIPLPTEQEREDWPEPQYTAHISPMRSPNFPGKR